MKHERHFMWLRHGFGNFYTNCDPYLFTPTIRFRRYKSDKLWLIEFYWFGWGFDIGSRYGNWIQ